MVGGATPDNSGRQILLSTRRMTQLHIDREAQTARCGAGVVLQDLHKGADEVGLRFPLSLGGKGSATVGGLVSTNAGGTQVLRHGTMRALVLGLKAVLPDGRILDASRGLRKDNRGFDLKQLFIGSEGTLGIVTQIVVKLIPAVSQRQTAWIGVGSLHDARRLLLHCEDRLGSAVEGFEVLPQNCLDHVVAYLPRTSRPLQSEHAWHVLLECVEGPAGPEDTLRDKVEACLAEAFESGLMADGVLASNEKQADAFWQLREAIAPAEKARAQAVQHDIAVAPSAMPDMVDHLTQEVERIYPRHKARAFGHLGDGNIHFHVIAPENPPPDWSTNMAKNISATIYDEVSRVGGTISAEHGIGQDKLATLARTLDPVALDLMRTVKKALDPAGLLNPGKLVPLAPDEPTS
jgi:FAD/FMN-containing dehydrogenase